MLSWLLALAAGLLAAWLGYPGRPTGWARGAAVARGLAVAVLVATLLDAPAARARVAAPRAALDVSASMARAGGDLWRAALDSARAIGGGRGIRVGDTVTSGVLDADLRPAASGLALPLLVETAVREGVPIAFVTDGELSPGTDALLDQLPPGSRVVVLPRAPAPDLAIDSLGVDEPVLAGDSAHVTVRLRTGAAGAPAATLAVAAGGAAPLTRRVAPLAAGDVRVERFVVAVPPDAARLDLVVTLAAPGDREPRNDTARVTLPISEQPRAVVLATAPDPDVRYALEAWRGAIGEGTRAWIRIAPGQWRDATTLAPVAEPVVRRRARAARTIVLQGDTAWLGPLGELSAGGILLVAPPPPPSPPPRAELPAAREEWFVTGGPPSPLSAALAGLSWDSLPPVSAGAALAGASAGGTGGAVLEAQLGRRGPPRPIVRWRQEGGRRVAVVAARGFAAWAVRPGAPRDAHDALWGGLVAWVAEPPARGATLRPLAPFVRAGAPIAWVLPAARRPAGLVARPAAPREDATAERRLPLSVDSAATTALSGPLPAGRWAIWTGPAVGAPTLELEVNAAAEWLPRTPATVSRVTGARASAPGREGLARYGWPFVLVVLALATEWLARRQAGLR